MPILTARTGGNADLLPDVFELYVSQGSIVADVTYGRGVFWKNIVKSNYTVLESDLMTGVDFAELPYDDDSIDCLILDPPYMHGGSTVKESINVCYRNNNDSHESIARLYGAGIIEAARVLKKKGIILVKTQDETESGRQRLTHVEVIQMLEIFGFRIIDLFVLVQESIPAMRVNYQKTARKNHSYLIVAQFRR